MKMKFLTLASVLGLIFALFTSSMKNPNNPPTGKTGAPGESTCGEAGCHSGGTFTGSVTISGVPDTAVFGQVYPITITNMSNAVRAGFQLTCLDSINSKCGTLASATGVNIVTANTRQYARQSTPRNLSGGSASWTFNWTAPNTASGQQARFYFTSLCANNNGQKTGDNVLTGSKPIVLVSGTSAVQAFLTAAHVKIYPTQVLDVLYLELLNVPQGRLSVYDTTGRLVLEQQLAVNNTIDVSRLMKGTYVADVQTSTGRISRKFVKY